MLRNDALPDRGGDAAGDQRRNGHPHGAAAGNVLPTASYCLLLPPTASYCLVLTVSGVTVTLTAPLQGVLDLCVYVHQACRYRSLAGRADRSRSTGGSAEHVNEELLQGHT